VKILIIKLIFLESKKRQEIRHFRVDQAQVVSQNPILGDWLARCAREHAYKAQAFNDSYWHVMFLRIFKQACDKRFKDVINDFSA
jgi:hypothetical protein